MLILLGQVKNLLFLCQNSASDGQMYAWSRKNKEAITAAGSYVNRKKEKKLQKNFCFSVDRHPLPGTGSPEPGGRARRLRATGESGGRCDGEN